MTAPITDAAPKPCLCTCSVPVAGLDELERLAIAAPTGAWRSRRDCDVGWRVETELPCINGLSAWFSLAMVWDHGEAETGYTDGAIGDSEDLAAYIAAASPSVVLALVREVRELRAVLEPIVAAREAAIADLARQGVATPQRSVALTARARAALNGDPKRARELGYE